MMILEGKAGSYIRDTGGFAKWDTSACDAVFEAYGGTMSKLSSFLYNNKLLQSYTHLKTNKHNLDYHNNNIKLTLTNAKYKELYNKEIEQLATLEMLKEYSCLNGLLALDSHNMKHLDKIHNIMIDITQEIEPTFT